VACRTEVGQNAAAIIGRLAQQEHADVIAMVTPNAWRGVGRVATERDSVRASRTNAKPAIRRAVVFAPTRRCGELDREARYLRMP
jgi:hypothetical protein